MVWGSQESSTKDGPLGRVLKLCLGLCLLPAVARQGLAGEMPNTKECLGPRGVEYKSLQALKLGGGSCREEGEQIPWGLSQIGNPMVFCLPVHPNPEGGLLKHADSSGKGQE